MESPVVGKIVVAKFFTNLNQNNSSPVVTRTLKKVGFVNSASNLMPANEEIWRVKIVKEICSGEAKGCYILDPISIISPQELSKLLPGMYEEEVWNGTLIVKPKTKGHNWVLPLNQKRNIKDCYSVVVCLE